MSNSENDKPVNQQFADLVKFLMLVGAIAVVVFVYLGIRG